MSIGPGARFGAYAVRSLIGAGGMGEVYRAHDSRLGRDVALKVLPEAFVADSDRLARFKREAHLLASLNHPNIAAIYGLEEAEGTPALVLELVEGPTLAEQLAQGPLPFEDALAVARQIASALDGAHEQGVVHRDLKPANIKVRGDGTVKVLDFGLAKALDRDTAPSDASMSPTLSLAGTRVGMILGTAAYMAPEQARGKVVDKRADIWAFGCVLFEMLAGRKPFDGSDVSEILAGVIKSDPAWALLPAETPAAVRRLLTRCLQKDPKRRLRDVGDAALEIDEALAAGAVDGAAHASGPRSRERPAWAVMLLVAVTAAVALTMAMRSTPSAAPELRLQIDTPPPASIALAMGFSVSPDGGTVAFQGRGETAAQIFVRRLGSESAEPVPNTERAGTMVQWSPDSRSLLFTADRKLRRVDIAGGNLQIVADTPSGFGASWGATGTVLVVLGNSAPVSAVAAAGGDVREVTRLEADHASHRFPDFLPDGRRFLFYVVGPPAVRGIYLGALDGTARRLFDAETAGIFMAPNSVLYGRGRTLMAQRIDVDAATRIGEPVPVVEGIAMNPDVFASMAASVSDAGLIAYRTAHEPVSRLVWFDRAGKEVGVIGGVPPNLRGRPDLSPDGRSAVIVNEIDGNADIWLVELDRATSRRLTLDPANDGGPVWAPDGRRIAFYSGRRSGGGGRNDLYVKALDGAGPEEPVLENGENNNLRDWSPDGRLLLYTGQTAATARDIWAMPVDGDRTPVLVVSTPFEEANPRFSPDGNWIAYQSNETGRVEVFVRAFPRGRSWQISTDGGGRPQWTQGGREVVYQFGGRLMSVALQLDAKAQTVRAAAPVALFSLSGNADVTPTADGRRFLVRLPVDDITASPTTLLINWAGAS